MSNPTSVREVKIPLPPVKSGDNSSRSSYPSPSLVQVQDESMMQVDQAIVAIGKSGLKLAHDNSAIESKEPSAHFPSTHDKSSDLSFEERAKLISTKEIVDGRKILSHTGDSEASQPHAMNSSEVSHSDTPQGELKIAVIPDNVSEPMQEQHAIPSDIVHSEVCNSNAPNNNQGRAESQEFSNPPIGEKSTVISSTESLADNTVVCVSETRQDNSILSNDMKRLDEERNPLAMNEVVTNEELIIPASSQQLPTCMTPISACTNSESATQVVQIERPSTRGKVYPKPT